MKMHNWVDTPKGIVGIGTLDSPFIIPDNRIELTNQDIQNILTYETFCAEKYKEINDCIVGNRLFEDK